MQSIDTAPAPLKIVMEEYGATHWGAGYDGYAYTIYLPLHTKKGGYKIGKVRRSLIETLEAKDLPLAVSLQELVNEDVDFESPKPKSKGETQARRRRSARGGRR